MQDYAKSGRNKDEWNGTAGFILHKDAGSTRQGAYDRSSIRVFEERMASEPNGDWLSGSRDSQKAVSYFLIETAKQNNFYIPEQQLPLLGERKHLPSGESVVDDIVNAYPFTCQQVSRKQSLLETIKRWINEI